MSAEREFENEAEFDAWLAAEQEEAFAAGQRPWPDWPRTFDDDHPGHEVPPEAPEVWRAMRQHNA